jgi:CRP/FNR family transcriptional regulator, cyclic AMP receptor protein
MATPLLSPKNDASYYPGAAGAHGRARSPYGLPIIENCPTCKLRSTSFFCFSSGASLQELDRIKHISSYPEGAMLFMEDEAPRGVYIVCQGRVKLLTTNSEGKTMIVKIAKPGDLLGLYATISGENLEATAETLQPTQLAFVTREDFLRYIRTYGDMCLRVAQHMGRDCHSAYEVIRSIALSNSVPEKLARLLMEWTVGAQESNGMLRMKLSLTHEEMAQLIGCSRESVSRALGEFRKQRLLELNGSTLLVRNKAALESLAAI